MEDAFRFQNNEVKSPGRVLCFSPPTLSSILLFLKNPGLALEKARSLKRNKAREASFGKWKVISERKIEFICSEHATSTQFEEIYFQ